MWKRETGIAGFALLIMDAEIRAYIRINGILLIGHNCPCTC
ncbi:hypothetical protein H171_1669 [[Clostridium] celerecrescens 18A]|uniref:Uncharacterized protein n=1 Tax=[Clostridium] celerecrescens 18A TaxID=1286362 RepID=A0A2M8Z3Z4_9FIRM|nr:hypothetical protein H171_1669 [[Clostridium] celerecrescens 18A]